MVEIGSWTRDLCLGDPISLPLHHFEFHHIDFTILFSQSESTFFWLVEILKTKIMIGIWCNTVLLKKVIQNSTHSSHSSIIKSTFKKYAFISVIFLEFSQYFLSVFIIVYINFFPLGYRKTWFNSRGRMWSTTTPTERTKTTWTATAANFRNRQTTEQ
jgi:hypothetical protein